LLDSLLGQRVRLVTRQGEISGRAVGIDDLGALLVERELPDGSKQIESVRVGDVHLQPAATDAGNGCG
jgi:biotin-(acetyl-CoA carboxylase) ligase